jgi:subtilisin family serine protease
LIDSAHPEYPASYNLPNQINVGASDESGNPAEFSNYGAQIVHILAPGVLIKSTIRSSGSGDGYGLLSGTSQATPIVALGAAILLAHDGRLEASAIKARLLYTADLISGSGTVVQSGTLNLARALAVDADLVGVRGSGTSAVMVRRGTIVSKTIQFATQGSNCEKPEALDVAADHVLRIAYDVNSGKSVLFQPGTRTIGTMCSEAIEFQPLKGDTEKLDTKNVTDLVWALRD